MLAAYGWWRAAPQAPWILGSLGLGLISFALVRPSLLVVPSGLWWRLAHILGWVNSRILLSAFFFGVLTPVGLLRRAGGWDPLQRKRRAQTGGWAPYPARGAKHYERMF